MQACYAKTIVRERAKPEDWTPETMLQRAIAAKTATTRAKYARLGLSTEQPLDRTTQSLLLRQLYLSYFESENFEKALEIAEQILALGIMLDVCRQDMARTLLSLGQLDAAVEHLRLAARAAPASRRSFIGGRWAVCFTWRGGWKKRKGRCDEPCVGGRQLGRYTMPNWH